VRDHRNIESLRLEKASKIIKSNQMKWSGWAMEGTEAEPSFKVSFSAGQQPDDVSPLRCRLQTKRSFFSELH